MGEKKNKQHAAFAADEAVINKVRALATAERRAFSQMVAILLEEALEARAKAAK